MAEQHDTVIIGGGQAGLAMSYHLSRRGRQHVIVERRRAAERWYNERWNSLRFQYPNWSLQLPGFSYSGKAPEEYAHYLDVARFIETYASSFDAPLRTGVEVTGLSQADGGKGYVVQTPTEKFKARNVVIATGPFQRAYIPDLAALFPSDVHQLDATRYRGPEHLPGGAVLVVGSGASGHQIADELLSQGRDVYFSLSRHRRVPRRYRGKDAFWWFDKTGRFDKTIDSFPNRKYPPSTVVTGANGGYDIDARRFAADGGELLGHFNGLTGSTLHFGDDANQILNEADQAFADLVEAAETLIRQPGFNDSLETEELRPAAPLPHVNTAQSIDVHQAKIASVIWCTGYRFDFGWVKVPVLNSSGEPIQSRGVTSCPGVYFLGLHWMHTFKSGQLPFVGEDAAYLADYMDTARRH